MGNICNKQKHIENLNISTPQFILKEISIKNSYNDLSNSQPIPICNTNHINIKNNYDNPLHINSFPKYLLPNSYLKPTPSSFYDYNNNNNNYNNNNNNNDNNNNDNNTIFSLETNELYFN